MFRLSLDWFFIPFLIWRERTKMECKSLKGDRANFRPRKQKTRKKNSKNSVREQCRFCGNERYSSKKMPGKRRRVQNDAKKLEIFWRTCRNQDIWLLPRRHHHFNLIDY